MRIAHTVIHTILDILFPLTCVGCQKKGATICESCLATLTALPLDHEGTLALYSFHAPVIKKAIHALKFEGYREVGYALGALWHDEILTELSDAGALLGTVQSEKIVLLPLPISKKRLRARGYNQVQVLAEGWRRCEPERFEIVTDVLFKVKDTERQVAVKNRASRLHNLEGSFEVFSPERLANRLVFLLDDVTTTGATMHEAKHALEHAGVRNVKSLALAH